MDATSKPLDEQPCPVAKGSEEPIDAEPSPGDKERFAYLPAALRDLEQLACGLSPGGPTPVSMLFEQRCAEAFRCLGFDVRELGQGCGRVADRLAVATAERFAVVIDAKVRRRGYTLGTDDRKFCEYATRHARELALSAIDKVYFACYLHGSMALVGWDKRVVRAPAHQDSRRQPLGVGRQVRVTDA